MVVKKFVCESGEKVNELYNFFIHDEMKWIVEITTFTASNKIHKNHRIQSIPDWLFVLVYSKPHSQYSIAKFNNETSRELDVDMITLHIVAKIFTIFFISQENDLFSRLFYLFSGWKIRFSYFHLKSWNKKNCQFLFFSFQILLTF